MLIHVTMRIADGHQVKDTIEIEPAKLGELTDDEIAAAIEIRVRSWVDKMIAVEWEANPDL